jgi:uncharacterized protein
MLISFSVENYRSFADEQTLSMEAVKDDAHPDHVVDCGRFSLLRTAAIYGANASGKSNLLKAFKFMAGFVRVSATKMNLGDPIHGADCFRLDKTRVGQPCSFDIRVLHNDTEYQYGFSATRERVHDEWLYITRKGSRVTNPLSRTFDPSTGETEWVLRGELEKAKDITEKTRDNGLFLSRAAEMNVECAKELFLWLTGQLWNLSLASPPFVQMQHTANRMATDDGFRRRVGNLLRDADVGIVGLAVTRDSRLDDPKAANALASFVSAVAEKISILVDTVEAGTPISVDLKNPLSIQTLHRISNSDEVEQFSLADDESNGTQRFLGVLGPILEAFDRGNLLVVDELDCSMHPQLTYKLVEMFQSQETNPKGAQLVFATHDTNLMTPALFRRDEIWLTEKNSRGATELYSLADIKSGKSKPRKDDSFEKHYLAGRYGGVPSFGPSLEDIGTP